MNKKFLVGGLIGVVVMVAGYFGAGGGSLKGQITSHGEIDFYAVALQKVSAAQVVFDAAKLAVATAEENFALKVAAVSALDEAMVISSNILQLKSGAANQAVAKLPQLKANVIDKKAKLDAAEVAYRASRRRNVEDQLFKNLKQAGVDYYSAKSAVDAAEGAQAEADKAFKDEKIAIDAWGAAVWAKNSAKDTLDYAKGKLEEAKVKLDAAKVEASNEQAKIKADKAKQEEEAKAAKSKK